MSPERELPETIENRWDILYAEYPEVYDEFAKIPKTPTAVEVIQQHFPLGGKTVADIGSGTGLSTFELARYAATVIGVEPEAGMRRIAEEQARALGVSNVTFLDGRSQEMPLPDHSVDAVTAITLASLYSEEDITAFVREAGRVARPGGVVLTIDISTGWYGGEFSEVIFGKPRGEMETVPVDEILPRFGYRRIIFDNYQDYGSVEHMVKTYGFIFGKKAIDYIRAHQVSAIQWRWSLHYLWV